MTLSSSLSLINRSLFSANYLNIDSPIDLRLFQEWPASCACRCLIYFFPLLSSLSSTNHWQGTTYRCIVVLEEPREQAFIFFLLLLLRAYSLVFHSFTRALSLSSLVGLPASLFFIHCLTISTDACSSKKRREKTRERADKTFFLVRTIVIR